MGKIKIGKIANRNIVAGDPNLVTKNELYLDVKKDSPLQIDLQRRDSNGTLKSILSSEKITIQQKKRPTYQLHQIKKYNRALLTKVLHNNNKDLYEWIEHSFASNDSDTFWIANINLGTLSKKRVYHIISLRSLYEQIRVDKNPSTFIGRPCVLYINRGEILADNQRRIFNMLDEVQSKVSIGSSLPYIVFVTQSEELLTRKQLGLSDSFLGVKIDVPFLCFPQELGEEHGFGSYTDYTGNDGTIQTRRYNPYGCSLSNCRWGNYLNKFPTWKDYYNSIMHMSEYIEEYGYIGNKYYNYKLHPIRRDDADLEVFNRSRNTYCITPFYRGQSPYSSRMELGVRVYYKHMHKLKFKDIWKE